MCYLKPLWFYWFFNNITFWIFLFTVNISLYYFQINVFSAGNFWMLLMTKFKSELMTGIFSLVLTYIIDNWCIVGQLLKLDWAYKTGLSSNLIHSKVSGKMYALQGVPKFLIIFLFFEKQFFKAKGLLKMLPISIQIFMLISIYLSKFLGCSVTNFEILIRILEDISVRIFGPPCIYFSLYYHPNSH